MENKVEKLHNDGLSARAISRELGISLSKVCTILKSMGYELISNQDRAKNFRESVNWGSLIHDYSKGMSMTSIGRKYGLSYDVVRGNFIKLGVDIRSIRESRKISRKYRHDNIFEPLTEEGAYLLGWILADGTIGSKTTVVKIGLAKYDYQHLVYLGSLFTEAPVLEQKKYHELNICAVDIYESLVKLGVKPRKSYLDYDINWSNIPKEHLPYLLLGLYEGDGSISKTDTDLTLLLPCKMWETIKDNIFTPMGITHENGLRVDKIKGNKYGLMSVRLRGNSYYVFGEWIYSKTKRVMPLNRKYQRFIDNLNRVADSKSKYKEVAKLVRSVVKG